MTLTEQWKKGELPYGYYYIKTISGGEVIDRYYRDCTDYDLCEYGDVWENRFEDEIIEVLAPVPSYEEWQQLNKFLEEFNALDVAEENEALKTKLSIQCEANEEFRKENQQLNERLIDMMDLLQKSYFYLNAVADGKVKTEHLEQIKTLAVLIDNAIGEK